MFEGLILHLFCLGGIGKLNNRMQDERQIVKHFAWFSLALSINNVPVLSTIWAFSAVFVFPHETEARIDTTVIWHRFKP